MRYTHAAPSTRETAPTRSTVSRPLGRTRASDASLLATALSTLVAGAIVVGVAAGALLGVLPGNLLALAAGFASLAAASVAPAFATRFARRASYVRP